jgi:hypothetical protein
MSTNAHHGRSRRAALRLRAIRERITGLRKRARRAATLALATAGLDLDDVVQVPVSNLQAGNQAFIEGRVDAGWHSIGSPAVQEADARKGGAKFLSIIGTPEAANPAWRGSASSTSELIRGPLARLAFGAGACRVPCLHQRQVEAIVLDLRASCATTPVIVKVQS